MKTLVWSLFDSKTRVFSRPFHTLTKNEAHRTCMLTLADPSSLPSKCPEDFTLFDLGTYDDETGMFELLPAPSAVFNLATISNDSAEV